MKKKILLTAFIAVLAAWTVSAQTTRPQADPNTNKKIEKTEKAPTTQPTGTARPAGGNSDQANTPGQRKAGENGRIEPNKLGKNKDNWKGKGKGKHKAKGQAKDQEGAEHPQGEQERKGHGDKPEGQSHEDHDHAKGTEGQGGHEHHRPNNSTTDKPQQDGATPGTAREAKSSTTGTPRSGNTTPKPTPLPKAHKPGDRPAPGSEKENDHGPRG